MIDLTEKLKITMIKQKFTQCDLAEKTNQLQNNLSRKMTLNNFKLSDYEKLINAMGCKLEINIILPNGEKI